MRNETAICFKSRLPHLHSSVFNFGREDKKGKPFWRAPRWMLENGGRWQVFPSSLTWCYYQLIKSIFTDNIIGATMHRRACLQFEPFAQTNRSRKCTTRARTR